MRKEREFANEGRWFGTSGMIKEGYGRVGLCYTTSIKRDITTIFFLSVYEKRIFDGRKDRKIRKAKNGP